MNGTPTPDRRDTWLDDEHFVDAGVVDQFIGLDQWPARRRLPCIWSPGMARVAPLIWITVWKDDLKDQRNDYEGACLRRLADLVPPGCRVIILADRGFDN